MPVVKCRTVWLLFPLFVWTTTAADHPIKLASSARIDLSASTEVGGLSNGEILSGSGWVIRPSWAPPPEQPRGYSVQFNVTRFATNEFSMRFVPQESGSVALALMGPWEEATKGLIYQEEVLWDSVQVGGASIANDAWTGTPKPARAWHDRRVTLTLNVTANTTVTLRFQARPVIPADFVEMKRFSSRATPAHAAAKKFLRGANLIWHLEAPAGKNWGGKYSDDDFVRLRAEGFDHVRLPIAWHYYASPAPEFTLSEEIFAKADRLVTNALARGLGVIIDLHSFDAFMKDPAAQTGKFYALWRQIAEHYARTSTDLAFELLNEPNGAAKTAILNPVYAETIRQIRQTNPRRTIFIDPGKWSGIGELAQLVLPDGDDNLIASVHCYEPLNFTRQGTQWFGPDAQIKGIQFPGPPETPFVPDASLKLDAAMLGWIRRYNTLPTDRNPSGPEAFRNLVGQVRQWSEYYGRPVHVGEFGCSIAADRASRARYHRAFRETLDEAGLGWAIADWKTGYKYWDEKTQQPVPGLREALFPVPTAAKTAEAINPGIAAAIEQLQKQVTNAQANARVEIGQLRAEIERTARKTDERTRWFITGATLLGVLLLFWLGRFSRRRPSQPLVPLAIGKSGEATEMISCADPPGELSIAGTAFKTSAACDHDRLPPGRSLARRWIEKIMRRLISERTGMLDTQRQAERVLSELERRLEKVHAPLQERLRAYEQRIAELETELAAKGAENRELLRATILLARKKLEAERAKDPLTWN